MVRRKTSQTSQPQVATPSRFDGVLRRFEQAWQSGQIPQIDNYLPIGPIPLDLLQELIRLDLEFRWSKIDGPHMFLEHYLDLFPILCGSSRLPIELIVEEYHVRCRWGVPPSHREFYLRFPLQEEVLEPLLHQVDEEMRAEQLTQVIGLPKENRRQATRPREMPLQDSSDDQDHILTAPVNHIGRYQLGEHLGSGGFGSVWRGWDSQLKREVAVKILRKESLSGPAEKERFLREARAVAQLRHPSIVGLHDVGQDQGTNYLVMELVEGFTLETWYSREGLSLAQKAEILAAVAEGLHYAHRKGIVHRDVKPSNILLAPQQVQEDEEVPCRRPILRPKITDFGLALRDEGDHTLTQDGQILGTPAYMSPEQIQNPHNVDSRSDIYSLGVILYELLTGVLPFRGNARMLLLQVVYEEPQAPRRINERIPRDLETICLKCLAKDPGQRYRSAGALAADLRRWLVGEPIHARPVGLVQRMGSILRRQPAVITSAGLVLFVLVILTGAIGVVALVGITFASILVAIHHGRLAQDRNAEIEELTREYDEAKAALKFAIRQNTLSRKERDQAISREAKTKQRSAATHQVLQSLLQDLPGLIKDGENSVSIRAFLSRTVVQYLQTQEKDAEKDPQQIRELALGYAQVGDLLLDENECQIDHMTIALANHQKSQDLFATVAKALPNNLQAQRDLLESKRKTRSIEKELARLECANQTIRQRRSQLG